MLAYRFSQPDRRTILGWLSAGAALPLTGACNSAPTQAKTQAKTFPVRRSDAAWRKRLTPAQYRILREAGTERRNSSALDSEKRVGTYLCAGCDNRLYSSKTKYDSGTGWPSFWKPLAGSIGTDTDYKLGYPRTEVHCADCGGHLGHVFGDGPRPTGKRYCMNGAAMKFLPA